MLQPGPQEMPAGSLVTVPSPLPRLFTVSIMSSGEAGLNVAATDRFASITTEQSAPLQSPLQPPKVDPTPGVAVKETVVPAEKLAMQVPGQDMPPGLLVTVPAPLTVTVSVTGGGGAAATKFAVTV